MNNTEIFSVLAKQQTNNHTDKVMEWIVIKCGVCPIGSMFSYNSIRESIEMNLQSMAFGVLYIEWHVLLPCKNA